MKHFKLPLYFLSILSLTIISCSDDEISTSEDSADFTLNINGLEDLGDQAIYEGWLIVDGSPVTTGTFTVDASGGLSQDQFTVNADDLSSATTFVLTIEPQPDNDPAPSAVHILAGDILDNSASLSIAHPAAIATDFEQSTGKYILATPTDDDMNNEDSGIWFLDNSSGTPVAGLELPSLPEGWIYEGWAVINGTPVSTGTFREGAGADNQAFYSGVNQGPSYPGEDFLSNAPAGLQFPISLLGGTAVISVEPFPDNSAAPFTLKPLVGQIDANATVHTVNELGTNFNFPSGSFTR